VKEGWPGEQEYERRTEGMQAGQAAAMAVEMSDDRKREEAGAHARGSLPS